MYYRKILGSHSDGSEEFYLLGYNAVVVCRKSDDVPEEHSASTFRVKE
jgi:hypothetical protein